ncbi:beta-phosphoglucomutase [Calorimonas adulescens]|uniref:Beta-phosphoglucomutase n=1 Tax=Calorimonas adulescens TaxID=2606906 RepID=A0A5D8QCD8_9THEO|nr:beta-phosphoglucomutase [Calorimonas adulescens]TZE82310.1 beta-phosphoglucomutase [Calorimonas adulescens]
MLRYEGMIFDLDGVLTDTARFHYAAWKRLCEEIGCYFDEIINEKLKGIGRMESLNIILNENDIEISDEGKQFLADRKNLYYKEMISKITPMDLLPGVSELFQRLNELGVKKAVASASRNACTVLERLGIIDYFQYIVDTDRIKNGKPDPEIFLNASKGLGIPPKKCIGVEDSQAGIEAIKKAGMYAIGIGKPDTLYKADLVLRDLRDTDRIISILLP